MRRTAAAFCPENPAAFSLSQRYDKANTPPGLASTTMTAPDGSTRGQRFHPSLKEHRPCVKRRRKQAKSATARASDANTGMQGTL